jgi:hypothetical protein
LHPAGCHRIHDTPGNRLAMANARRTLWSFESE